MNNVNPKLEMLLQQVTNEVRTDGPITLERMIIDGRLAIVMRQGDRRVGWPSLFPFVAI